MCLCVYDQSSLIRGMRVGSTSTNQSRSVSDQSIFHKYTRAGAAFLLDMFNPTKTPGYRGTQLRSEQYTSKIPYVRLSLYFLCISINTFFLISFPLCPLRLGCASSIARHRSRFSSRGRGGGRFTSFKSLISLFIFRKFRFFCLSHLVISLGLG